MSNGVCSACRSPQYWNAISGRCEGCPSGLAYDFNQRKCSCPSSAPYIINGVCQNCQYPSIWNAATGRCEDRSCQPPLYWNQDKNMCDTCQNGTYYMQNSKRCERCPTDKPLWNGKYCVICPAGT